MAIMKSGMLGAVSGRVGGVEFAQWGGSAVVKSAKLVRRHDTPAKLAYASKFRAWQALWGSSGYDSVRAEWAEWSSHHPCPNRFGVKRLLTPEQSAMVEMPAARIFGYGPTGAPCLSAHPAMSALSVYVDSVGDCMVTTSAEYDSGYSILQVQIHRFWKVEWTTVPNTWTSLPLRIQSGDAEDFGGDLSAMSIRMVPGETWIVRARWNMSSRLPSPWAVAVASDGTP